MDSIPVSALLVNRLHEFLLELLALSLSWVLDTHGVSQRWRPTGLP